MDDLLEKEHQYAAAQRSAFIASLPKDVEEREDKFPRGLALDNASPRSRLNKLYKFTDEVMSSAQPYIACKSGCSSCCRMNVTISKLEAEHIERETGRKLAAVKVTKNHPLETFNGIPCPFLKDDQCSIYEVRPYACRKHVSFASSDWFCHPDRSQRVKLPMVRFSGLNDAFCELTQEKTDGVLADIRDFFPDGA